MTLTYNDPVGLSRTIESLKPLSGSKSLGSWEHVVVDSSPSMNTAILDLPGWPLTRVESPPRGIYPAFNLGLKSVSGDLVWFLNGGDQLLSLENLVKAQTLFIQNPTIEIVAAPVKLFRGGKYTYDSKVSGDFSYNIIGQNGLCHQGILYRKTVFEKVGFYDESFKLAGDYEHHFRCLSAGVKFAVSDKPFAQYNRDGRSDQFEKVFAEFQRVWAQNSQNLTRKIRISNLSLGYFYLLRTRLMRSKILKPFSRPLKEVWYFLNRSAQGRLRR